MTTMLLKAYKRDKCLDWDWIIISKENNFKGGWKITINQSNDWHVKISSYVLNNQHITKTIIYHFFKFRISTCLFFCLPYNFNCVTTRKNWLRRIFDFVRYGDLINKCLWAIIYSETFKNSEFKTIYFLVIFL